MLIYQPHKFIRIIHYEKLKNIHKQAHPVANKTYIYGSTISSQSHFDADQKINRISLMKELLSLNLFYDNIIGSEVFLKVENSDELQIIKCEIKLIIPGKELFAKKTM